MAYNKTIWENLPSTNTPINETNLNNMENGIEPANTIVVTDTTVDLNNYIHDGSYYFPGGTQTVTNIPAGINGWLRVMESTNNGFVKQIWYRAGTPNANDYQTFVRTYTGGIWSDWKRYQMKEESEPVETTLTLNMTYFDTVDNSKVVKSGNVVQVFFRAHTKQAIPNGTVFATLPYTSKINPVIPIYSGGRYSFTDPIFSYVAANSKNWAIAETATDKWLQAVFTYITSD